MSNNVKLELLAGFWVAVIIGVIILAVIAGPR